MISIEKPSLKFNPYNFPKDINIILISKIEKKNRNSLEGLNLIGLRRKKVSNDDIMLLLNAYKEIFKTEKLSDNLKNLNGEFKNNILVNEVIDFIKKDKKRPICTPLK